MVATEWFAPTGLLEARLGFSRFDLNFTQEGAALRVIRSNQGPMSDGITIFSPGRYSGIGQTRSLPIIRGRHTLKFGFDAAMRNLRQFQSNRGNGRFNFSPVFSRNHNSQGNTGDSMASLLLGAASTIEEDSTLVFPNIQLGEYSFFVQDDWKVSDRLTLNIPRCRTRAEVVRTRCATPPCLTPTRPAGTTPRSMPWARPGANPR